MNDARDELGRPGGPRFDDIEEDAPLTPAQERMMAWLDGELSEREREDFELEIARDPELRAEVERFTKLFELTDMVRLPEPADHEIRRFWTGFYNRSEWQVGWILMLGGLAILAVCALWLVLTAPALPLIAKAGIVCALVGFALVLFNTIRLRQRVARFDRYRGVLR